MIHCIYYNSYDPSQYCNSYGVEDLVFYRRNLSQDPSTQDLVRKCILGTSFNKVRQEQEWDLG